MIIPSIEIVSLIVSIFQAMLALRPTMNFNKQHELLISQSLIFQFVKWTISSNKL